MVQKLEHVIIAHSPHELLLEVSQFKHEWKGESVVGHVHGVKKTREEVALPARLGKVCTSVKVSEIENGSPFREALSLKTFSCNFKL